MRLESGSARMDALQLGILAAAFLFFAAWFYKDGKWTYLEKNRVKARQALTPFLGLEGVPAQLGERPTNQDFDALVASNPQTFDDVIARLGPPKKENYDPSLGDVKLFYSDYGMITVTVIGGKVKLSPNDWKKWEHEKGEIDQQFYWGIGSGVIGLWLAYRTFKAATLRVVIDESGMTYGSKRIPFSAMTRLAEYKKKGLCSLYYNDANGQERRLRLDSYKVAKFEEIIDALVAAKGFSNPRPPEENPDDERREESSA